MNMKYDIKYNDTFISLEKTRNSKFTYSEYLIELNKINLNDYHLFKSSRNQRLVLKEDIINFTNSKYILFKKDKHKLEELINWIDNVSTNYIHKPFPPFNSKRIKIII